MVSKVVPIHCSQMSLYDWIRLSHVEKRPKKYEQNLFDDDINGTDSDDENNIGSEDENDKVTFHHFLKDHPLYHSHWTICMNGFQILLVVQFQEVIMEIENITALLCWHFLN